YIPPKTVKTQPIDMPAVEAMYNVIKENPNEVVILSLGPHTNTGTLIKEHPEVVGMIKHIYCEGCSAYGNRIEKNWKNYVSFNASTDAEALKIVMESGIPITIIPSRMGRDLANFNEKEVFEIRELNDVGKFFFEMYNQYWEHNYKDRRIATNDTCAVLAFREPGLFKTKKAIVEVDTKDIYGRTNFIFTKKGHVNYAYKVNRKKFKECFHRAIKKLDGFKFYK
ncbi:MAG: nucleoside hydrolase, partial [Clostridia bacterium]|nr:nucleoside hydrolase [Clostridia bacterium]